MSHEVTEVPGPVNEPELEYTLGSAARRGLEETLRGLRCEQLEIPLIIGGEEVRTGDLGTCVVPHDHGHVLARYHRAGPEEVERAADAAAEAWGAWSALDFEARAAIFLRMADLLSGPWRMRLNAATMLGQSKTPHQAEIDAAAELVDFLRFNVSWARDLRRMQPISVPGAHTCMDYRALEGFVFAVTPFNFTSIAGNLPTAPALLGNTVVWKPASSAVYSGYHLARLFEAAGLPPGVINFVPGPGDRVGRPVLARRDLAGIHFTGSTPVFQEMWRRVGENIASYRTYPRIVGETGGKGFVFVHASADPDAVVANLIRGAFEYQGQKCSAASRAYLPESLWPALRERLADLTGALRVGDPTDFQSFMGAVIDEGAFRTITASIEEAQQGSGYEVLVGGDSSASRGYFVDPTIVISEDSGSRLMREEIFEPVLTVHVYPDAAYEETLGRCDRTSPYALTGAIFATERGAIETASSVLRHAAGNFYINDKPTGAVVGQQPFGGARASGTNDKAGSMLNLTRWTSARTTKENLTPDRDFAYSFMER